MHLDVVHGSPKLLAQLTSMTFGVGLQVAACNAPSERHPHIRQLDGQLTRCGMHMAHVTWPMATQGPVTAAFESAERILLSRQAVVTQHTQRVALVMKWAGHALTFDFVSGRLHMNFIKLNLRREQRATRGIVIGS